MKCQTFGLNGRLSKIPQLQPKPLVGSSLVRHRTDEVFYLSIIISGIHPFYDHLSRHLARPNSATNELFFSLRTETLRLSASRIQISLLIESSLRDIFVYDLLRRDFATPDLAPRTRLEDRILISTTLQRHPTRLTTRKDLDVLEDIFNKPSEKVGHCLFFGIGLIKFATVILSSIGIIQSWLNYTHWLTKRTVRFCQ